MDKKKASILFLGKEQDPHSAQAAQYCRQRFTQVETYLGKWGDPLPPELKNWQGDYIISYLSRWVVPQAVLQRATGAAINFHPATPDYPGIGCTNFALYEDAPTYGVTCHHMAPTVDTGAIIAVSRFPILPEDDVASLLARTYSYQFALFKEVIDGLVAGQELPKANEHWTRVPFSRREFEALRRITPGMSREEIARRVRATAFGQWMPYIELEGYVFSLKSMNG